MILTISSVSFALPLKFLKKIDNRSIIVMDLQDREIKFVDLDDLESAIIHKGYIVTDFGGKEVKYDSEVFKNGNKKDVYITKGKAEPVIQTMSNSVKKDKVLKPVITQLPATIEEAESKMGINEQRYQYNGINVDTYKYDPQYDLFKDFEPSKDADYYFKDGQLYVRVYISKINQKLAFRYKLFTHKVEILSKMVLLGESGATFRMKSTDGQTVTLNGTMIQGLETTTDADALKRIMISVNKSNLKILSKVKLKKLQEEANKVY